jgi:tripartite-type tricarboxylate transporter receptor subunit TctC
MKNRRHFAMLLGTTAAVFLTLGLSKSFAADYPDHPIRMIVAQDPGTSADLGARQLTAKIGELLKQNIIIDNRGGAGGILGTELAAKAPNDGYTLIYATAQTHAADASLYAHLPYDPVKDFTPIARVDTQNFVLVVSPTLPIKSVADLIAYAKTRPGQLYYASTGNGTTAHLAGALFDNLANVQVTHVPYKGAPQAITDMIGGSAAMMFYPYIAVEPMIRANKLTLLASTGEQREPYLPNTPTMIEAGLPGFLASTWHGIYGPAGMAKDKVDVIYKAVAQTLKDPDILAAMAKAGVTPTLGTPDEFAAFTKSEVERYHKIVAISGAKID